MTIPTVPPPDLDELSAEESLDDWHREVIAERLAAADRGDGNCRPWDEVRRDLLANLRAVRG